MYLMNFAKRLDISIMLMPAKYLGKLKAHSTLKKYKTPNQASAIPARVLVRVNTMALFALFARGWENERNYLGLPAGSVHSYLLGSGPCQLVEQLNDSVALIK